MTFIKKSSFVLFLAAVSILIFSCGGEATATAEKEAPKVEMKSDAETKSSEPKKGGILKPVTWGFDSKSLGNDEFELTMTANLDKGWSIYSQHTSDDGPVPTAFEFESDNFEAIGAVEETGDKTEGIDPLFEVNVIKFKKGPVVFTQKVKVTDYSKPVSGYLTYMTCDDEKCLPPTDVDFSFALSK